MLKNHVYQIIISATIASVFISGAQASESCIPIEGTGMSNFVPQKDGATTIVASLSGSVTTASGKISTQLNL